MVLSETVQAPVQFLVAGQFPFGSPKPAGGIAPPSQSTASVNPAPHSVRRAFVQQAFRTVLPYILVTPPLFLFHCELLEFGNHVLLALEWRNIRMKKL